MPFSMLDCVVLTRDVPQSGRKAGDLGSVVETYEDGSLEVEFVSAHGETTAVLTLTPTDVRGARHDEVLTVRSPA